MVIKFFNPIMICYCHNLYFKIWKAFHGIWFGGNEIKLVWVIEYVFNTFCRYVNRKSYLYTTTYV